MTKIIVGLTGLKGAGKDTAAAVLVERGFAVIKFADGLKNMVRALLKTAGMSDKEIEVWVEGAWKETPCPALVGKTPRYAMQTLGTEWGRQMIGNSIWTDITLAAIAASENNVVITDLRFPNEYRVLNDIGAAMFRIERGIVNTDLHESEKYVAAMPVTVIDNNGTVEELKAKMLIVLNTLEGVN